MTVLLPLRKTKPLLKIPPPNLGQQRGGRIPGDGAVFAHSQYPPMIGGHSAAAPTDSAPDRDVVNDRAVIVHNDGAAVCAIARRVAGHAAHDDTGAANLTLFPMILLLRFITNFPSVATPPPTSARLFFTLALARVTVLPL